MSASGYRPCEIARATETSAYRASYGPGSSVDESAASTAAGCHSFADPEGRTHHRLGLTDTVGGSRYDGGDWAIARMSTLRSAISRPSFVTALSKAIPTAGSA